MSYPIEDKLVIAVSSSALFNLEDSDRVFRESDLETYRCYQRDQEKEVLSPGVAFPLIRRLLILNGEEEADRPIEVVLLSKNDPDTGARVFHSIEAHGLDIVRAGFVNGGNPFPYMEAFNASLFLSANQRDIAEAVMSGAPAGRVLPTGFIDDPDDPELRIAFDFDGILADDSAETVFQAGDLKQYHESERVHGGEAMSEGPLYRFFHELARVQKIERARQARDNSYRPKLRTAIVTARSAPAHTRLITTLREWGVEVDEVFLLGGIEKARVLGQFRPHIFFDDQVSHVEGASEVTPSVHVPFGVANVEALRQLLPEMSTEVSAKKTAEVINAE